METTFAPVEIEAAVHRGTLTPVEMGRGVLAINRNARRLFEDAVLLLENDRFPSAVAMAILAHEEVAKFYVIGMVAVIGPKAPPLLADHWPPRGLLWKSFENHPRRNLASLRLRYFGAEPTPEIARAIERIEHTAKSYVALRVRASYVDCVAVPERWSLPDALIDRNRAVSIVSEVRGSFQEVPPPAAVAWAYAMSIGSVKALARLSSRRVKALLEWSKSSEAVSMTRLDQQDHSDWTKRVDAILAKVLARVTEAEP